MKIAFSMQKQNRLWAKCFSLAAEALLQTSGFECHADKKEIPVSSCLCIHVCIQPGVGAGVFGCARTLGLHASQHLGRALRDVETGAA